MPFSAPECLRGDCCDGAPADIWSLGVVILEMRFGLRALSKALRWDIASANAASTKERGAQLTEVFTDPEKGLSLVRASLGKDERGSMNNHGTLVRMLDAAPMKRPEAAALQSRIRA